jgi:phosphate transport system permease protein
MRSRIVSNQADRFFKAICLFSGFLIIAVILALFFELIRGAWPAVLHYRFKFLISTAWNPVKEQFGSAGAVFGTLVTTLIAMCTALPVSLGIALFLTGWIHPGIGRFLSRLLDLLAAIPSIIFGMWGLFIFAPFMSTAIQPFLSRTLGFLPLFKGPYLGMGILTAGLILAMMILPYMSAMMRSVMQQIPVEIRESASGLGATQWEASSRVFIPFSRRGLLGAGILGLGRAAGETMAVAFVIGSRHALSASLFSPGHSITSILANEFTEASSPLYRSALVELGLILFLITALFQLAARFWLRRMERKMGVVR